ncbi:hypothetical protein ACFL04_04185 [Patescibacteria group bacterium]
MMRFEKIDGQTHIWVGEGETEFMVLMAIAKVSFSLAKPAGSPPSKMYDPDEVMDDTLASTHILLGMSEILYLDYAHGRTCKTALARVEDFHFVFNNAMFEPDRGDPAPMLEEVKKFLATNKS